MNTTSRRKSPATQEQVVLQMLRQRGLFHTRDIAALGVPTVVLTRPRCAGKLERAGRGVYALREGWRARNTTKVTIDALWRYATINRVGNVMRPYLESLA